jgi:NACHT domain
MALAEILTIKLGGAVAKSVLRNWLAGSAIGTSASASIVDVLTAHLPSILERRRAERQFDLVAEEVAANLEPLIEHEFRALEDGEKISAIMSASESLGAVTLSEKQLIDQDLDPAVVERAARHANPNAAVGLSEGGVALYDLLLRESCNYVVEVLITLPRFTAVALRELLARETELIGLVRRVLAELPQAGLAGRGEGDAAFEAQYTRQVARKLDRLELFGVTVSELSKRYALSVAYITLTATPPTAARRNGRSRGALADEAPERAGAETTVTMDDATFVRVDHALAGADRVLVRGDAGSGKTTLLQWLAVQSARRTFAGVLEGWNGTVPFFIQLRRYVRRGLPRPEEFLDHVAPHLAGAMPAEWVHRQLDNGRALLLIDGIDEVPEAGRTAVRDWLDDLLNAYPSARAVVTSRPAAVGEGWLRGIEFADSELQPMTTADTLIFIDHWHDAARASTPDADDENELEAFRRSLHSVIRNSRPIRALATSPLLCAMICALNRDRRTQLPRDRMELYRISLESLLERRDVERQVAADIPRTLTLREKELLLEDLAFWLIRNGQSDAEIVAATDRIHRKLQAMPHVAEGPEAVFRFLLVRTGLLRTPVEGRVDFLHRTFQEYLAARAAIEDDDVPMLVANAHRDQWREVVVMAAGHAQTRQRIELIRGLVERGDRRPAARHRLHLVAVACLDASPELPTELVEEVRERLAALIPPQTLSEAKAVSSAGELAVPLLARAHSGAKVQVAAATVRALAQIGGEQALEALKTFGRDRRVTVARELVRAWPFFDAEEFARDVLAESMLDYGRLHIADSTLLAGVKHLKNLQTLSCEVRGGDVDLSALANVSALARLEVSSPAIATLDALRNIESLEWLNVSGCSNLFDIEAVRTLPNLKQLDLTSCEDVADGSPIGDCHSLEWLRLMNCGWVSQVDFVSACQRLTYFDIEGCENVLDVSALALLENLEWLDAARCPGIASFDPLGELISLRSLRLSGCSQLLDLDFLTGCRELSDLSIDSCENVASLAPVAALKQLTELQLSECDRIESIDALAGLPIRRLSMARCGSLRDISPIAKMKELVQVSIPGSRNIESLEILDRLNGVSVLVDLEDAERVSARAMRQNRIYFVPSYF